MRTTIFQYGRTGGKNLNERLKELKCINEHNFNWYALEKMIKSNDHLIENSKYNITIHSANGSAS